MEKSIKVDTLVIGSGGAGLTTALWAKKSGSKVLVVSESYPTRSQTSMAQGGINAVLYDSLGDSIEKHIEDTLRASRGFADESMVKMMCESAPKAIEWLDSIGVVFSRDKEGNIAQRKLGGTKYNRACYSQDYTGLKILQTLFDNSLKEEIDFLHEHYLVELIIEDNIAMGAIFLDIRSGELKEVFAKSVVLATGGYGGIYHSHTTNSYSSTGDAIAICLKHRVKTSNLDFIQFHPTGLKKSSVLISESARGAGGKLLNQNGERFVDELLPRDEVSLAIWEQIESGNDVFLDIRHLGEEFIDENLPQERKLAKLYEGIDPVSELVPIKPVAHYSMGGVSVDENLMSSVKGLFAVGECSDARVHGANRLGGNSLLEIVAFGMIAGEKSAIFAKDSSFKEYSKVDEVRRYIEEIFEYEGSENFYQKRDELGEELYYKAGIKRDKQNLLSLVEFVENLPKMGIIDKSRTYNNTLVEFLKFENSLLLAKEIANSAMGRLS